MVMLGHMEGQEDNAFSFRSPDGGRTWPDTPLGLGLTAITNGYCQGNQVYVVSAQVCGIAQINTEVLSPRPIARWRKDFRSTYTGDRSNAGYEATGRRFQ